MFFKKRPKKEDSKCTNCKSSVTEKFSFCPYCGDSLIDEEQEMKNFGMLGRKDMAEEEMLQNAFGANMGIADKLIGSLMNTLIKNLDMQIQNLDAPEIKSMPNGIKIKIHHPNRKVKQKKILDRPLSDEQLSRMSTLPRSEAKTTVRRLSDKVVYELNTQGVESAEDIFISKLESGYEIKALGKNKIYVNSVPITLPLRGFALHEKGLIVEFSLQ